MSYTEETHATIAVRYSDTFSYPASQTGGVKTVSGTVYEDVTVYVHVDTVPFDAEIDSCRRTVDTLTGSVVATESAQVLSIHENSRKVGNTIIRGFFKTVQSDISQQIAALQSNIDSLLLHLRELSARCLGKTRQMETDYQRISSRYLKIFGELDKELENRIHAIDAPVFAFTRGTDGVQTLGDKMVATAAVSSAENARLHARISAAMAKRSASAAMRKAERYLDVQYTTDDLLATCLRPGGEQAVVCTPCMLVETTEGPGYTRRDVYSSPLLEGVPAERLTDGLDALPWQSYVSPSDQGAIATYFNTRVGQMASEASTDHDRRVASMTAGLFNLSRTATTGC